jgi:hypothetical protein
MAVRGALPAEDRSLVRHRNPLAEWDEVPDVPFEGHHLPERWVEVKGEMVRKVWPPPTTRWWGVLRRMPHCRRWAPSDWEYAFATAEVHARFYEGHAGLSTELRLREGNMGMTAEDRRKLRIRYVKPAAPDARESKRSGEGGSGNVVHASFGDMYGGA